MKFLLYSILFLHLSTLVVFTSSSDLGKFCRFYNNSLQIIQQTTPPLNSLALVPLCPSIFTHHTQFISSPLGSIISYDFHLTNGYLLYLTQSAQLYIASLNSTSSSTPPSKLYEHLTASPNDTTSLPEPIWSYRDIKPSSIALDWIHELLYLVDETDIHVSSMYSLDRSVRIISRHQATIKRLTICPALSMLVWQEIEWTGHNYNSIQIAQQDGTEMKSIYLSKTFIVDLQLDQHSLSVYFVTGNILGVLPLKTYHQMVTTTGRGGESLVQKYPINGDVKHFAVLSPYILYIRSGILTFHDLRGHSKSLTLPFRYSWSPVSSVQNAFTLLHQYAQPTTEPICPQPDSPSSICKDLCLPNGYVARYTCMCTSAEQDCPELGHHGGEAEEGEMEISSGQEFEDSDLIRTTSSTTPDSRHNPAIVEHSSFSESFWDDHEPQNKTKVDLEPSIPPTVPTTTTTTSTISTPLYSPHPTPSRHIISEQLFLISRLHSPSTTVSRLLWFTGRRVSTQLSLSHNRFLFRLNRWLEVHTHQLIIALAIGLFILIALATFAVSFLIATLPSLGCSKTAPKAANPPGSSAEVTVVSVNKLYQLAPELLQEEGSFTDRQPQFENSFQNRTTAIKQLNHWTVLDDSWPEMETTGTPNSPSTSQQEMTTFENWEYTTSSTSGFGDLVSNPVNNNNNFPLYL